MTDNTHHAGREQRNRQGVASALLSGVFVLSGAGPATPQLTDDLFERHEVATGEATESQTVLTGFFLGGAMADLAVLTVDENDGGRRLRIYGFSEGSERTNGGDRGWLPKVDATLHPQVLFVDAANIGGRDRLIIYERVARAGGWDPPRSYESGRLSWFDPESVTERALMEISTTYKSVHDQEGSPNQPGAKLPQVDITRDLNHDGRDDLVVPAVDGFWVSTQLSDGSFADPVKLGPPEPFADASTGKLNSEMGSPDGSRTYGDVGVTAATLPIYLSRIHELDYDQDGRSDLVFWNDDHFDVYTQDEHGSFSPPAETFTTDVSFDSEGAYSRMFEFTDQSAFSLLFGFNKKTTLTVLHSFHDLNGDQVADLVTLTLTGRTMLRQRSLYEVHFGAPTADSADAPGIVFARDAGAAIQPGTKAGGLEPWGYASHRFEDLDDDGRLEIMFRGVGVGFGGMSRALVGNSVPLDLEFYRIEHSIYPSKPTVKRKIRRFAPFAGLGNIFFPPVLLGDVNGDGRSDLLVGQKPGELRIFFGLPGPGLFAHKPLKVTVDFPSDERKTRLVDLNQDGKQDLILHHTPTARAPTEPHRVTMLIAR